MNTIYLFSHSYPFSQMAEIFLDAEIKAASKLSIPLTIIPLQKDSIKRDIPKNILLDTRLCERSFLRSFFVFGKMIMSKYFWKLPFQGVNSPKGITDYKNAIKYLYGSFLIKDFILSNSKDFGGKSVIYSYWFTNTSLGALWAKEIRELLSSLKIVTRAHGFDVYEKKVGVYFPYREFILKNIDKVYTVSDKGRNFILDKYDIDENVISTARLGTKPLSSIVENKNNEGIFILSCSSIIPLKRVELIFSSLNSYAQINKDKNFKWIHFGDGEKINELRTIVKNKCSTNFQVDLKGYTQNSEIRKTLTEVYFDVFINLSTSEGVPVSIMEAISAGIPILATDVGGNSEIVTSETGVLIPLSFTQKQFDKGLNYILEAGKILRKTTLKFYVENYNAELNYKKFYEEINR